MARISTRWLLTGGLVGPALFLVVVAILGAVLPGYDPKRHFVSLSSLGPLGGIQVANFVLTGVLIVGLGVGLARLAAGTRAGRWRARAVVAVGLGMVVAGVFQGDPGLGYPPGAPAGLPTSASWHAGIHYVGAMLVFVGLPVATIIDARAALRDGRTAWAAYALLSGAVVLGGWLAGFVVTSGAAGGVLGPGLLQRLAIVAGFQWLIATVLRELAPVPPAGAPARRLARP